MTKVTKSEWTFTRKSFSFDTELDYCLLRLTHQMSRKKRKDPVGPTVRYAMMNYTVVLTGT